MRVCIYCIVCALTLVVPSRAVDVSEIACAIKTSDAAQMRRYLDGGLDPNLEIPVDDSVEKLLILALVYSDDAMASLLIERGATANVKARSAAFGTFSTAIALRSMNPSTVALLIKHGGRSFGLTPLMLAVMEGDLKRAETELKTGADVNAENEFGLTALDYANPIPESLRLLLRYGAKHSYKAEELAAMLGDIDSLKEEIARSQNVMRVEKLVRLAIIWDQPVVLQILLEQWPKAASEECLAVTPAHLAVQLGRVACLRYIIAARGSLDAPFPGKSLSDIARQSKHSECARILSAAGYP